VSQVNTKTTALSIGAITTLTGDSGGAISPDGSGNINVIGDSVHTITTGSGSSITVDLSDNTQFTAVNGWDGSIIEDNVATVTSDGVTITLSIEKIGGGDLTVIFSDGYYEWDTTPAATITLTAGSDSAPQENFVYLLQSTKTLTVSTTAFPLDVEFAAIATVICQSAASLQTDGPYKVHIWTDHVDGSSQNGHISEINSWIRNQNATWSTGVLPTLTITTNGGSLDDVIFTSAAGVVLQLHDHDFPAFTGTPDIYVINDFTTPYSITTNLNTLLTDSLGNSMSGKYFSLVIWGVVSEDASDCKLMCNLPSGSYTNESSLISDPDKYSVFTIPREYRGTGFLIANLLLRHQTAAGGTWTEVETVDLRGQIPTVVAGGTTLNQTEFADNVFKIFDESDATKIFQFQASGISTATTRTLTVQDSDGTIAYLSDIPTVIAWSVLTGATKAALVNEAYFANYAGTLAFTLPATAAVGDTIQIAQMAASQGWSLAQNAGQTCYIGNTSTTTGAGGSLASTADGDWIEIVCRVANTDFAVNVKSGNITVV